MSAAHVSLRASHKFPGQWERWESDDGQRWRMVGTEARTSPSEDDPPALTARQEAWLEDKAEEGWPQTGPCRWLPGGCLVVECQGLWGPETFVLDREGNEL